MTLKHVVAPLVLAANAVWPAAGHAQSDPGMDARAVVEAGAEAMGGLDAVMGVENLVLTGYGQYIYQMGGGNITGSPDAPVKWQEANDVTRTYDPAAGQMRLQERRNFLFPFALSFGHSWNPADNVRTGRDALGHPLMAVRAALEEGSTLSDPRVEDGAVVVDFVIEEGDQISLAFHPDSDLPAWVRWSAPDNNLGEVTYTTHFTGYQPYDGIELPSGFRTEMDWRQNWQSVVYAHDYEVDAAIEPFPEAPAQPPTPPEIEVTDVAPGVWHIGYGNSGHGIVEFSDHLVMFEPYGSEAMTLAIIDAANQLVPGKEVTAVVLSHHHFDHSGGLRAAVSRGLTVYSRPGNEGILREMVARPAPNYPDALARNPLPLDFVPVDESLRLEDETMTMDILRVVNNAHMADAVFAYLPEQRVVMQGDLADNNYDTIWWGDSYEDSLAYHGITAAETDVPVHGRPGPLAVALDLIRQQVAATEDFCAQHEATGITHFPGCPLHGRIADMVEPAPLPADAPGN